MATKSNIKKKSPARIEKDCKRKAAIKRRKMLKTVAMVVVAVALILLMVFAFAAPPRPVS